MSNIIRNFNFGFNRFNESATTDTSNEEIVRQFIKNLREEASATKTCFTNFSFQAMLFSSATLAAMFAIFFFSLYPYVVVASIPSIALLMIVSRIGIFKYATANRQYGYELHLGRTRSMGAEVSSDWKPEMRHIPWEEALRAWRIVQTAIFRRIYIVPESTWSGRFLSRYHFGWLNYFRTSFYLRSEDTQELIKKFEKNEIREEDDEYPWFMPRLLTKNSPSNYERNYSLYYTGAYLKNVLGMLLTMQYLLLIPWFLLVFKLFNDANPSCYYWLGWLAILVGLVFLRPRVVNRRRHILENEVLSIHSCAIVWQAVVLAHYRALKLSGGDYKHHTEHLVRQAEDVAQNAFSIHKWCKTGGAA